MKGQCKRKIYHYSRYNKFMEYTNMSTLNNSVKMGLNNKICENPVFFCRAHLVYLSEEDVKQKSCMNKLTPDMLGYRRCGWLIKSEEYEKEKKAYKNDIQKIEKSKQGT